MAALPCARVAFRRTSSRPMVRASTCVKPQSRPAATAVAQQDFNDLDPNSSLEAASTSADGISQSYEPLIRARARKAQLPRSRYQYRPPKFYRGPLHPHQPPKPSDPASREFIPGPFTLPRMEQTYNSTVASDLLTLSYQHYPPGYQPAPKAPRLRSWDGTSPYHKNRPLRGPRGGDSLNLLKRRITFRNIPKLTGVTVHSFVKDALNNSGALHVAGMALQAITGTRCKAHAAKRSEVKWGLRAGKFVALTNDLKGEDMYHFLSKLVDVVMPRVRDWQGVKGSSGDDNGNISFGLTSEMVAIFPEIEVNYDAYPPALIPGCHITIKTSATTDRDARLLLNALGLPFYGKLVN